MREIVNIAVCDDQRIIHEEINKNIKDWNCSVEYSISHYYSAEELLACVDFPDIVLLDIDLGRMNGFQAARVLYGRGCSPRYIMLTGRTDLYSEAFEINADAFISKPVDYVKLFKALNKSVSMLRGIGFIEMLSNNGKIFVRQKEIMYFLSDHNIINVFTVDNKYYFYETFQKLKHMVDANLFFECHKGIMINISMVKELHKTTVLLNCGIELPVSRRKYSEIKQALNNFGIS